LRPKIFGQKIPRESPLEQDECRSKILLTLSIQVCRSTKKEKEEKKCPKYNSNPEQRGSTEVPSIQVTGAAKGPDQIHHDAYNRNGKDEYRDKPIFDGHRTGFKLGPIGFV
jgi:hypothetical protein